MATYDNDAIRKVVHGLRALPMVQRMEWCMREHPEFASAFPTLLKACTDDTFDLRFLDMMLEQRARLQSNVTDVEDADRTVYDTLRENYITPLIGQETDAQRP